MTNTSVMAVVYAVLGVCMIQVSEGGRRMGGPAGGNEGKLKRNNSELAA